MERLVSLFELMDVQDAPFYRSLWAERRLHAAPQTGHLDWSDELNARLACQAIARKRRLLLVLPDAAEHRPAAILATALVRSFVLAQESRRPAGHGIYFGSRLGIRSELDRVSIGRDPLANFIDAEFTRGTAESRVRGESNMLPRLYCVYRPSNVPASLDAVRPVWVAVDCEDDISIPWLDQLLTESESRQLPVVAWSTNPLSAIRDQFPRNNVFAWPARWVSSSVSDKQTITEDTLAQAFDCGASRNLIPCVITGDTADKHGRLLSEAESYLGKSLVGSSTRLAIDTARVLFRLQRTLERLPVPLTEFETECPKHWGVGSVASLLQAGERFVEALGPSDVRNLLESALNTLSLIVQSMEKNECPVWSALIEWCVQDLGEVPRCLVFTSRAHRRIFSSTLIALENTSIEDLRDMGICLCSSSEVGTRAAENPELEFTYVGIPTYWAMRQMEPALRNGPVEILSLPRTDSRIQRLAHFLDDRLSPDAFASTETLRHLIGLPAEAIAVDRRDAMVQLAPPRAIQGRPPPLTPSTPSTHRPILGTPEIELEKLLESDLSESHLIDFLPAGLDESYHAEEANELPFVEHAVLLHFRNGSHGLFARDTRINFVSGDGSLRLRFVRSARAGEKVIYIRDQAQQSLYELVLHRIHAHPSIRTHLEFVRNWQAEAERAFDRYLAAGHTFEELLQGMRLNGSDLSSTLSLRLWAEGRVMRPRDPQDLVRLAEILDMPFCREFHVQIHQAGNRIHGVHIQLSLRLRQWILAGAGIHAMRSDLVDAETGLTFGDIQDAIELLEILSVEELVGPFYRGSLGHIEGRKSDRSN